MAAMIRIYSVFLYKGQQTALVKGQIVNILGSESHIISSSTTQFGHCSIKATIDIMQIHRHDCMPCMYTKNNCVYG